MREGSWKTIFGRLTILAGLSLAVGCGGDSGDPNGGASQGGDGDGITTTGDGDGSGDGSGDGDGTGDGTEGDGDGEDDGGEDPKWDVTGIPDGPKCGAGPGGGDGSLSYIWIANSGQSPATVSKVDTETMIEEGRYITRPDGAGSPSRTSVNLNGNMAVSSRQGGVTKIWADTGACPNTNPDPGLQTSEGGNDVLAWGDDECIAWHTPMNCSSNRPMAWTKGDYSDKTCGYDNPMLWTSCWSGGSPNVLLLDGETGTVEEQIPIQVATSLIYGGAVDGDDNFWGVQNSQRLIRVDREDFTVESWPLQGGPGYGIAVDSEGRPWLCGGGHASRFDPVNETWQMTPGAGSGIGGCMTDGEGTLYHSRYGQGNGVMVAIDTESVTVSNEYAIPAYVHGVSVDFAGKVWGVTFGGTQAFRLDVESEEVDTFTGLVGAYTYSDMTGFALSSAGKPNG